MPERPDRTPYTSGAPRRDGGVAFRDGITIKEFAAAKEAASPLQKNEDVLDARRLGRREERLYGEMAHTVPGRCLYIRSGAAEPGASFANSAAQSETSGSSSRPRRTRWHTRRRNTRRRKRSMNWACSRKTPSPTRVMRWRRPGIPWNRRKATCFPHTMLTDGPCAAPSPAKEGEKPI